MQNQPTKAIHTIFGAGQVGQSLAGALLARNCDVRLVRRGEAGPGRPGLTWLQGDIRERDFARGRRGRAQGASVVYNCTNPDAYHRWHELLPPLYEAVADAAAFAKARLVTLDNVYMYGDTQGEAMTEDTPATARTKKGALRAELFEQLRARSQAGQFHLSSGRASDFFGPGARLGAVFSTRAYERLATGKPVEVFGDPSEPHSFSYIPDVARGLAALGTQPTEHGGVFHLPVAWQGSTQALLDEIATELGHTHARTRRIPGWFLNGAGTFVPLLGALAEMSYQWNAPFRVSDEKFVQTFGFAATPAHEAIVETARSIQAVQGPETPTRSRRITT